MIGKMTITEVLPELEAICKEYGFKLYRLEDFKIARRLLAIRYSYYGKHQI